MGSLKPQTAGGGAVNEPGGTTLSGDEKLLGAGATTDAGVKIGVTANQGGGQGPAGTRGDIIRHKSYTLVCKKGRTTSKPTRLGYGKWCSKKQDNLVIRILHGGHKLRITWYAPATGNYAPLQENQNLPDLKWTFSVRLEVPDLESNQHEDLHSRTLIRTVWVWPTR